MLDLGLQPPFSIYTPVGFFDPAYRARVDVDYFAERWRAAESAALHVAAWHFWERDPQGDEYLKRLIEACHRHAIQVYAWLELPHVSELFWDQHPEWREKTALLQDAQLDWRKLVNLTNRDAFAAAATGTRDLLTRFDWDGVNLAELYFESLEGHENPARFTPLNEDVRREFQLAAGFDPLDLFDAKSPRHWQKNASGLARFLDFRALLAQRQQTEWIAQLEEIRRVNRTRFDTTHIDDRLIPACAKNRGGCGRVLPLLAQHSSRFSSRPGNHQNLGPQRYPQSQPAMLPDDGAGEAGDGRQYRRTVSGRLPTKQQTGAELFQLVHRGQFREWRCFEASIAGMICPGSSAAAGRSRGR